MTPRPTLVAATALLIACAPRLAAQASQPDSTPARGTAVQPAAPQPLAIAAPAAARAAPDSSHPVPRRPDVGMGVRVVAAGITATLLSVDNGHEWRRCSDRVPDPYPSYDRALSRPYYDGLCLRRWQHHVARVFIANTAADVVHDLFGLRPMPAGVLTSIAVGAGPHAVSRLWRSHDPPPTTGDALADVWLASTPLALALPKRLGGRWGGMALWLAGYAALYPYARP